MPSCLKWNPFKNTHSRVLTVFILIFLQISLLLWSTKSNIHWIPTFKNTNYIESIIAHRLTYPWNCDFYLIYENWCTQILMCVFLGFYYTHTVKPTSLIPTQYTVHTWSPWTWSSDWPSAGSSPRVAGVEPERRSPPWFWSASPHCCSTTRMLSCLCQLLPGDPTNRDNI